MRIGRGDDRVVLLQHGERRDDRQVVARRAQAGDSRSDEARAVRIDRLDAVFKSAAAVHRIDQMLGRHARETGEQRRVGACEVTPDLQ